jgi:hypothetical protein
MRRFAIGARRNYKMPALILDPKTHIYTLNGREVPGISRVIAGVGLINSARFTDFSRDRGTMAHLACQLHDEGDLDESTLDPVIVPYLEGWKKFREQSGFVPNVIEKSLYSPLLDFAGTPDRYGKMNGNSVIAEIKTGGISFVTGIQLAAQDFLFQHAMDLHADKRLAVQLTKEGNYKLTQYNDQQDYADWLGCLTVEHCKIRNHIKDKPWKQKS